VGRLPNDITDQVSPVFVVLSSGPCNEAQIPVVEFMNCRNIRSCVVPEVFNTQFVPPFVVLRITPPAPHAKPTLLLTKTTDHRACVVLLCCIVHVCDNADAAKRKIIIISINNFFKMNLLRI
jgi:hypothetical protein